MSDSLSLSPWDNSPFKRFSGRSRSNRTLKLQDPTGRGRPDIQVNVEGRADGSYNVNIAEGSSQRQLRQVRAQMDVDGSDYRLRHDSRLANVTIVPGIDEHGQGHHDQLHTFYDGNRVTLRVAQPLWTQATGHDGATGGLRAPMPSLVVDIKVKAGDKIEASQALVVLESMKTEIVLRAGKAGVVRSVNCKQGEMVSEGHELIVVDE
jgi:3-methylcrotonyl-CoA carboxylase alpha subunit